MQKSKIIPLTNDYKRMVIAAFINATACSVAIAILLYYQPPLWILMVTLFIFMYITFTALVVSLHLTLKRYEQHSRDQKS